MKAIRAIIFAAILMFPLAAGAATVDDFKDVPELWEAVRKNWNENINGYTCDIFSWAYRTPLFIKNHPEHFEKERKDGKEPEPDWLYRVYGLRFKKPRKVLLGYDLSLHEHTERGSIIDRGVAYMLKYVPGTLLNFGYKDEENVYVVFPKASMKQIAKKAAAQDERIGPHWLALMRVLLIASYREVYWKPTEEMKDARKSGITDVIIGETMDKFEQYFGITDGSAEAWLEPVPLYTKDDYVLNKETGWLKMKKSAPNKEPKNIIKIVFTDKNKKRCRNINRREAFVDPETLMFMGMHEFENDRLVSVYLFSNLKINVDLPDSLWSDFFKKRRISDKK